MLHSHKWYWSPLVATACILSIRMLPSVKYCSWKHRARQPSIAVIAYCGRYGEIVLMFHTSFLPEHLEEDFSSLTIEVNESMLYHNCHGQKTCLQEHKLVLFVHYKWEAIGQLFRPNLSV